MNLKEVALRLNTIRTVCLTGNPVMLRSRIDFMDMLIPFGLSAIGSVSKRTGALIACAQPQEAKIAKAEATGVPILEESQWFDLIPELEKLGMRNGKNFPCSDENGIYRINVDGDG